MDTGLKLAAALVAEGGDFIEIVSQRSNAWALTSLVVRDSHGRDVKKRALHILERVSATVQAVRVHLENDVVRAFIEATKDEDHDAKDAEEKEKLMKEMRKARMDARAAVSPPK